MNLSNKKVGFGDRTPTTNKRKSLNQQQLENIRFEALKMHQKKRFDKAEIGYKKLIKYGLEDHEVFINLYQIYKEQTRIKDAYIIYKKIIKDINLNHTEITINFLDFLLNKGQEEFANKLILESLKENNCSEKVISFYAKFLMEKNNYNLALNLLKKGLINNPSSIFILSNIGYIFQSFKEHSCAINYYKKALIVNPKDALVLFNIANCYEEIFNYEAAITYYKKSLLNNSKNSDACWALGSIYYNLKEFTLSKRYLRKCLKIDNTNAGALIDLLNLSADICDWQSVKKYFELFKNKKLAKNITPFPFLAIEDNPNNHLLRAINTSKERFKEKPSVIETFSNKKKRIGYFSSDFYNHATMHLMQKVFELHDKDLFEIFIYSYGEYQDEVTEKLKKNVFIFRDISLLTDKQIAIKARADKLDIAIDLKGYTRGTRLSIFQHRVAKIQISYLGYPGSTGTEFIDYLIADRILIPRGNEKFYSEKIIFMPDSYQCNDESKVISKTKLSRKDYDLPEESIIFTCFNAAFKITEKEFNIWIRLLKEIDNSHLWLFNSNILMKRNLKKEASNRGVDPKRIIFAEKQPLDKHLSRHSLGDIFLDTFNYNAHTTASDALWAGMPLITLAGKSFSSRVAASLLNSLGLKELICKNEEEYFSKALDLGKNPTKISLLKEKIIKNKISYPLFDSHLFTKNYEYQLKKILESKDL